MSRLNYSPLNQAFILGSQQIKDTQEEIAKLKSIILETSLEPPKKEKPPVTPPPTKENNNYMRIGYPDNTEATFYKPVYNNFDSNLLSIIKHPKFDDVVKNYVLNTHPEWVFGESRYVPNNGDSGQPANNFYYNRETPVSSNKDSKSTFGNKYSTSVCYDIKNYIIFFLSSLVIYLLLSKYFG
jgi:hypothetical protein